MYIPKLMRKNIVQELCIEKRFSVRKLVKASKKKNVATMEK